MSIETEPSPAGFSETRDDNVVGYQPVHWLAVVALIVSLISMLALATSFLWFTPLIAIGAAVVALIQTRPGQQRYSGRTLAVAALVIGVFSFVVTPVATFTRHRALLHAATEFSTDWLNLVVDGQEKLAHQYTLETSDRRLNENMEVVYKPLTNAEIRSAGIDLMIDRHSELQDFIRKKPFPQLLKCGQGARIELVSNVSAGAVPKEKHRYQITQIYRVTPTNSKGPDPVEVRLVLERRYHPEVSKGLWRVVECEDPQSY